MASWLLWHAELRSAQDELTNITTAVFRIQDRLKDIIRRSGDEARSLQDRMNELEAGSQEMSRELNGLWELNQELQEVASKGNPETDRAIEAKNVALRKLRHARKVIRDLLDERRIGLFTEYERLSPISGFLRLEGREAETLDIESLESLLGGGSDKSKSSSEDTVRPEGAGAVQDARTDTRRNSPDVIAKQESPGRLQTRAVGRNSNTGKGNPKDQACRSPSSAGATAGNGATSSSSSDQGPWRIHYSRPPLSKALACGPMPWANLTQRLSLDDDTVAELRRLASGGAHGLPLQIIDDLAFVYDPIILEGPPGSTYLIDWGREKRNMIDVKHVTHGRTVNPVFHTFFFPVKKDNWYYFGAMTWAPVKLWSIWPTLGPNSRAKLTAKLRDRSGGNVKKEEIIRLIEEGSLQQICFEISGNTTMAASRAFATKMGFKMGSKLPAQ